MPRIIAVTNQKGGVGKTTTSINLAACLGALGRRVLLVDLDPQGNATMGSGVNKAHLEHSSYELLMGHAEPAQVFMSLQEAGYALIPANGDLTAAEVELVSASLREQRLRFALERCQASYDYVLVDCPPSLNMLTINALVAADGVLIPMQCEYYALEGLSALLRTIERVRQTANQRLEIEGLLRTMFDPRNRLSIEVSRQLITHFGDSVYRTIIPRNVRLAEAPSHGLPVTLYDRTSRGALAYRALAAELQRRHRSGAPLSEAQGA